MAKSMAQRILEWMDATPNRGDLHVFLGHPLSDACDKTTVEPGNSYSPGVWTCGICLVVAAEREFITADLLPESDIEWEFQPPGIIARYRGLGIAVEHEIVHRGGEGAQGADFNLVRFVGQPGQVFSACLAVRDVGPAGGRISSIESTPDGICIDHSLYMTTSAATSRCTIRPADADKDSCAAVIECDLKLDDRGTAVLHFKSEHGFSERTFGSSLTWDRPWRKETVPTAFAHAREQERNVFNEDRGIQQQVRIADDETRQHAQGRDEQQFNV